MCLSCENNIYFIATKARMDFPRMKISSDDALRSTLYNHNYHKSFSRWNQRQETPRVESRKAYVDYETGCCLI